MSSPEETTNLKAGHPPAVKVGGMRITQHKTEKPKEEKETRPVEEDAEQEAGPVVPEVTQKNQNIVISGAITRGDADFPPEAIKAFHEKPVPSHDYRPAPPKNHTIQQPRK